MSETILDHPVPVDFTMVVDPFDSTIQTYTFQAGFIQELARALGQGPTETVFDAIVTGLAVIGSVGALSGLLLDAVIRDLGGNVIGVGVGGSGGSGDGQVYAE